MAYANLPPTTRREMYLECFQSSLGSPSLQRHLLVIRPTTLAEAVLAGNEYLQVLVRPIQTSTVHQVEDEPEGPPVTAAPMQPEPLTAPMEAVAQLTKQVSQLKDLARPATPRSPLCWKCNRPGHF